MHVGLSLGEARRKDSELESPGLAQGKNCKVILALKLNGAGAPCQVPST